MSKKLVIKNSVGGYPLLNNGFTLIELLAVIVILAIIALIAIPIVLDIIEDSKQYSSIRSAEYYLAAVEQAVAAAQLNNKVITAGTYTVMSDGNICLVTLTNNTCSDDNTLEVNLDGERPSRGSITITSEGKVTVGGLKMGNKAYSTNSEGKIEEKEFVCKLELDEDGDGIVSLSDVITCGTESFYVMSNDENNITMLSMYNLYVGNFMDANSWTVTSIENPTGIQNIDAKGYISGVDVVYGTVAFSESSDLNSSYWNSSVSSYPAFVYNSNSAIYSYVSAYENYLKENGVSSARSTLMSFEQAKELGCDSDNHSCTGASWVYSTSYWTGTAYDNSYVWIVSSDGAFDTFGGFSSIYNNRCGVRPVVTISNFEIQY